MSELTPEDFLFMGETKILGFGETDTTGMWVKLQVHDLEVFRGMKGEILETALRVVNNDGTAPAMQGKEKTKQKVSSLCMDAVMLCKEESFQNHCWATEGYNFQRDEEGAKRFLCFFCEISSRTELDRNERAAYKFAEVHRKYSLWVKTRYANELIQGSGN